MMYLWGLDHMEIDNVPLWVSIIDGRAVMMYLLGLDHYGGEWCTFLVSIIDFCDVKIARAIAEIDSGAMVCEVMLYHSGSRTSLIVGQYIGITCRWHWIELKRKNALADMSSPMHSNRSVAKQVSDFHQGTSCLPSTARRSIVLGPSVYHSVAATGSMTVRYCSRSSDTRLRLHWLRVLSVTHSPHFGGVIHSLALVSTNSHMPTLSWLYQYQWP